MPAASARRPRAACGLRLPGSRGASSWRQRSAKALAGLPTEAGDHRVAAVMARLGLPLDDFGGRSPYTLSGGEQRRLSLVPALVREPRLLVLDEPTFGQDRRGCEALESILDEHVAGGTAVLAATHDERFIASFATRIIRLDRGRIASDEVVA
ncbi:MAG: ATP-binding cassette domain-containing protein [Chloroflexota bacterium]